MSEEWRDIPGFPGYQASDRGRVRSLDRLDGRGYRIRGKVMSVCVANGYGFVKLRRDGRSIGMNVHVLIARAFLGDPPFEGAVIRHLDDVRTHNDLSNLAWGTQSQNALDAVRNGRHSQAGRVFCRNGKHLLSGDNAIRRDPGGTRLCKPCRNEWQREYRTRRAAEGNPIKKRRGA